MTFSTPSPQMPTDKEISCRVTKTLILYVREVANDDIGELLNGLPVSESYLTDTNNWVSLALVHRLYNRMIRLLGDEQAVYDMAMASERLRSLGILDRIVRLIGSPKLIYAQAPKYNKLLKLNGDVYVLDIGNSWALVEDRYHDPGQKTRYDCDYTRGILAGIPTMFGLAPAEVEEIECQVAAEIYGPERAWPDEPLHGGRGCLYRVQWRVGKNLPVWDYLFRRRTLQKAAIEDLQEANRKVQEKYDEVKALARDLEAVNIGLSELNRRLEVHQAELIASERRYRLLAENVTDVIWTFCLEKQRFTYISPSVARVWGYAPEEAMAMPPERMMPPDSLEIFQNAVADELSREISVPGERRAFTLELRQRCKSGLSVWSESIMTLMRDDKGRLTGILGVSRDISRRKKVEAEITFLAYHDSLTGLRNRKAFYEYIEDFIELCDRYGTDTRWALLFLDLDNFKSVNDTMGHDTGDELLKIVADRLKTCLTMNSNVYRLGGDEFTIILRNIETEGDILPLVREIQRVLTRRCIVKENDFHLSVSIGVSIYPDHGKTVKHLVKNADMAMYAAKSKRSGYCFFTEAMNRAALERMRLESDLRKALANHEFELHYQALVDRSSRIVGVEALIRWRHPDLGMISPGRFIPVAEETGAIVEIGKWVLEEACARAKAWMDRTGRHIYMAVNLSARQFVEAGLVSTVERALSATGLPADRLKLEITESLLMENPRQAIEKMGRLRELGIGFSIDDFGTGYSSLSYLKKLPVDDLKIDRAFVMDLEASVDDQEIIRTIIAMAKILGKGTVAEGVENRPQRDFLDAAGCQIMQGFYFSKPLPEPEFLRLLERPRLPAGVDSG